MANDTTFDVYMTGSCSILRQTGTTRDDYNQPVESDFTALLTGVACRHSTKGPGREYKQDKQATVTQSKFFMRSQSTALTSKDRILYEGTTFNILSVLTVRAKDSSIHHLEIEVEEIEPGDSGS